jgi:hypothetical protein
VTTFVYHFEGHELQVKRSWMGRLTVFLDGELMGTGPVVEFRALEGGRSVLWRVWATGFGWLHPQTVVEVERDGVKLAGLLR